MPDQLADFATVWLKRWTVKGGSAIFDVVDGDKIWLGQPIYDLSPGYPADEAQLAAFGQEGPSTLPAETREQFITDRRRENDHRYEGAMRELSELLTDMPGGIEAVKNAVRKNPALGRTPTMEG